MELQFSGDIWFWRGPAPFHFVTVPDDEASAIAEVASLVTYGWGMIPVQGTIGTTAFTTSLWPKDGGYIVPIKALVQKAESVGVGDTVTVTLNLVVRAP